MTKMIDKIRKWANKNKYCIVPENNYYGDIYIGLVNAYKNIYIDLTNEKIYLYLRIYDNCIMTQSQVDKLQIEFNNLMRDGKEVKELIGDNYEIKRN